MQIKNSKKTLPLNKTELIGLVPAAGFATRISPLPCSKEIYPLGFRHMGNNGEFRSNVACDYLLENMSRAGVKKAFIIIRPEKWDIPLYLRSKTFTGMHLAYIVVNQTAGTPFTIDHAFPFVKDAFILFGFPDIIFNPENAFIRLINRQQNSGADIVLGLYPAQRPHKMDMVKLDGAGRVEDIIIKPDFTKLKYTWIIAAWTNIFTQFMHNFLSNTFRIEPEKDKELYMGDIIRAALKEGIRVQTLVFDDGMYLDIGTFEDLIEAVKNNIQSLEDFKK